MSFNNDMDDTSGEFSDFDSSGEKSTVKAPSWLSSWLSWRPTSVFHLICSERALLNQLTCNQEDIMVRLTENRDWGRNVVCYLRTLVCRNNSPPSNYNKRLPIVLLHGMGAGVGLWLRNLDSFAEQRTVIALDLLGFGRSSRVQFAQDAGRAEAQMIDSLENWRQQMGLEKFILMGHSMGGFLAYSYALHYPERISDLILADPWGFPEKPPEPFRDIPKVFISVAKVVTYFNPLSIIRVAGPFGPGLIRRFRGDLTNMFAPILPHNESHLITDYIYHANAQNPSGESAFKALSSDLGYACFPMVRRCAALDSKIPVTFIYGGRSWMDYEVSYAVKHMRKPAYTHTEVINGAGHHVYAQRALQFNAIVNRVCARADLAHGVERSDVSEASMLATLENAEFMEKDLPEARYRRRRRSLNTASQTVAASNGVKNSASDGGVVFAANRTADADADADVDDNEE